MKYCPKCKRIYNSDEPQNCLICARKLINDPTRYSPVNIITANGFELERIKAALTDSKIPFSVQETAKDTGIQILNAAPPENGSVFVPLGFYTEACELLTGIGAMKEAEELNEDDKKKLKEECEKSETEFSDKSNSFLSKLLFIIMFAAMIAAVVFVADLLIPILNPHYQ